MRLAPFRTDKKFELKSFLTEGIEYGRGIEPSSGHTHLFL
jgi:hypothetical protein